MAGEAVLPFVTLTFFFLNLFFLFHFRDETHGNGDLHL